MRRRATFRWLEPGGRPSSGTGPRVRARLRCRRRFGDGSIHRREARRRLSVIAPWNPPPCSSGGYDGFVFQRKTSGSVVCPSCGSLVGVRDDKCYSCGRANPGLWGFAPLLRQLGRDLGFVPLVIGSSAILYLLTLL